MVHALQVTTIVLVAVAMALALSHALELPGKLRLSREQYLDVQPIYYPGFTIAGGAEPLAILLLVVNLVATPITGAAFWLTLCALLALLAMHACYWLLTHPVNNFWLKDFKLPRAGAGFFSFGLRNRGDTGEPDWTELRNRWEFSHAIRAALGLASLILLVTAFVG